MGTQMKRRDFLALMGLSGATAATIGCSGHGTGDEKWHPWVEPVANSIPYVPSYYATTTRESDGCGLWVKVINGRAVKVEGHPDHPINKGTLTARQQSVIQGLYNADRIQTARLKSGEEVTRNVALAMLDEALTKHKGANISALTNVTSGSVNELWTQAIGQMGQGRVIHYDPQSRSDLVLASEKVFGQAAEPFISLEGTDYIFSLGARFLETWGDTTANSRHYAEAKTVHHGKRAKHVQVEAKTTLTGAAADKVLPAKPGSETMIALALLQAIQGSGGVSMSQAAAASGLSEATLTTYAEELRAAESPIVLPGESLSLGTYGMEHHVAVLLLNQALGSIGKHFNYAAAKPITRVPSQESTINLINEMRAGRVKVLIISGCNPVYNLPKRAGFAAALEQVDFTVCFSDHSNETTALADLVIPVRHDLESWGEVNTYQGLDMLMQPVMKPRWDVQQVEDHLIRIMNTQQEGSVAQANFHDYLKASWIARFNEGGDGEALWRESLKNGGRFNMPEATEPTLQGNVDTGFFASVKPGTVSGIALVIGTSSRLGDGNATNRGWLQELPDGMTGIVWDSWLEMSYHNGESMNIEWGDVVKVEAGGTSLEVPVALSETISDDVVYLETGQGHTHFSKTYNRGVNAYEFLPATVNSGQVLSPGPLKANISKTGRREKLATFHLPAHGDRMNTPQTKVFADQPRWDTDPVHERHILEKVSLTAMASSEDHGGDHGEESHGGGHGGGHGAPVDMDSTFPMHKDKDFYPDRSKDRVVVGRDETFYQYYKWEMGIDLNTCNGCGSCVVACYAENNLPVVGKDQVAKGREMAWMRINRYLDFTEKDGHVETKVYHMPMMCQQCGSAPCESVCPSLATYHSKEGLNAMVYNRCVGTRYCANNCSYKVRRFNWFTWDWEESQSWYLNPTVSVREKGVMEKCTFCVQRIRDAKDTARDEGRLVRDGEVQTACQQACPSKCITFGNFSDHDSEIYKIAHDQRAYRALDDHIATRPGVSYLKRVVLEDPEHA